VNVVMNLQVPRNAGNVACFLPGRATDLSTPLYCILRRDAVLSGGRFSPKHWCTSSYEQVPELVPPVQDFNIST